MASQILFTRKQVADILMVKTHTLYKWEKARIISPSFYVNNKPRYSLEEVQKVTSAKPKVLKTSKSPSNG